MWRQGMRLFGWSGDGKAIYALRNHAGGLWALERITIHDQRIEPMPLLGAYQSLSQLAVHDERVVLIAGSSTRTDRVITLEHDAEASDRVPPRLTDDQTWSIGVIVDAPRRVFVRRRASAEALQSAALADAQPISWTSFDGESAHGLYFAPSSTQHSGIGAPPLIVLVHGGPTSQQRTSFQADVQFFATRGFAVLTPNHRGSTGYGRAYMLKHRGMWGVYDVEDSAAGALHLAALGLADRSKFVIMGGSAGGYTTLQSLVAKPGFYRAGVCAYGISNQFLLSLEPGDWKFESRYNDHLIGVLPHDADRFRERSPLFHAEKISDPVILFQGADDEVVPKAQSDQIVAALRARGVPHAYHVYAGEGHGWRNAETIEHYYKTALAFLHQYVVFV
jgi:dipeptidyl aminopeptidase/acylaminoacyl peptidase